MMQPLVVPASVFQAVVVPANARSGMAMTILTPTGQQMQVTVPAGMQPGETFQVQCAATRVARPTPSGGGARAAGRRVAPFGLGVGE